MSDQKQAEPMWPEGATSCSVCNETAVIKIDGILHCLHCGDTAKIKTYEEGMDCIEDNCIGSLEYIRQDSCSCHINPPCSSCVNAPLTCNKCGELYNE